MAGTRVEPTWVEAPSARIGRHTRLALRVTVSETTSARLHIALGELIEATPARVLLGLDSDTFYIYHVTAVMVDNLRRLLLGINLSDKAVMDFDFPGVGFPV